MNSEQTKKLKVLFQSDFSLAKTGFGRATKALLLYLWNTGKYDITHYCCGMPQGHPDFERTPWKSIGCLPNNQTEIDKLNQDPQVARNASYGAHLLDQTIEQEKPDVYIAAQDIWGVDFAIDKPWFKYVNPIIWTTLDSLPILPTAIQAAKKTENFWVWSNFATKELHNLGHKNVKTVHGPVESSHFYKRPKGYNQQLRNKFNISQDEFIIGFVFRNQTRKSVPNLMEGFKKFIDREPKAKAKLLLHTHFSEGWDILRLADQYKVPHDRIFTSYLCSHCKNLIVHQFVGQEKDCPICGSKKTLNTTHTKNGITEDQLNDVYNLMDVYCHPFNSGGQEIPIQEAKLTELITLVTNYSCGEEMCEPEAASLALDWAKHTEHGTQFIKASTNPESIYKQLKRVYEMAPDKKIKMEKQARQWTLENYSAEVIGKQFEEFLDKCKPVDYSAFSIHGECEKNPEAQIDNIQDDALWLIQMYDQILGMKVDGNDEGFKHWDSQLKRGVDRKTIEDFFRKTAAEELAKQKTIDFEDLLDGEAENRIIYIMPESIGDVYLSTALFKSLKEQYPGKDLYVATKPEYHDVLAGNPHVHRVLPFMEQMNSQVWLEGQGDHKGYFAVAMLPYALTQRFLNYLNNGQSNIAYKDLKY